MKYIVYFFSFVFLCSSCAQSNFISEDYDPLFIFDEFWNHVDQNYIYFDEKEVDWNEVYSTYAPTLNENSTQEELLVAIENSMFTLKDAHNIIRTPLRNGLHYDYDQGYEIHFSESLIENTYVKNEFQTQDIIKYGLIDDQTLYIYLPEMQYIYTLRNLLRQEIGDQITSVILDVRNNRGGNSNPVPQMLGDFVKEKTYLGAYIEKSGPKREDETLPIPVYAEPSDEFFFDVDVFVLTNRTCFSATSYLAAMCKGLSNFTLVGQVTGGGGGGNAGFELSNGWSIAISVSDFIDKEGRSIELGVEPNEEIENAKEDIENGRDRMLEKVLELIK